MKAALLGLLLTGCVRRVPIASPPAYCSPVPAGMVLGGWIVALPEDPDKPPAIECYYFRAPAPDVPDGQPLPAGSPSRDDSSTRLSSAVKAPLE